MTLTKVGWRSSRPEILGSLLARSLRCILYFMVSFLEAQPPPQSLPQTVLQPGADQTTQGLASDSLPASSVCDCRHDHILL